MEWITQLFEGKRDKPLERIMIVRARDQAEINVLTSVKDWLAPEFRDRLSYAVVHDRLLRSPM